MVCTLVGLDTIGSVASNGAEGFTWLIVLAIAFFAPYALLTSKLGTTFPAEGGVPGTRWVAVAFSVLTSAWALLATVALPWPGFGTSNPRLRPAAPG